MAEQTPSKPMSWLQPPTSIPELAGTIQLWWLGPPPLDIAPESHAILAVDEVARANRFILERKRSEFVYYRASSRRIFSRYLQATPESIPFTYGTFGKPSLEGSPFYFNLSHSGSYAILAVSSFEVGVDLEQVKNRDVQALAQRFFSNDEKQRVVTAEDPLLTFHQIWTAKESVIKAHGTGLTTPLNAYSVPPTPLGDCQLEDKLYSITRLEVLAGYSAALSWVKCDTPPDLHLYNFP